MNENDERGREKERKKRLAKKKSAVPSLNAFAFALQMLNDAVLLKFVAEQSFILSFSLSLSLSLVFLVVDFLSLSFSSSSSSVCAFLSI